MCRVLVHICPQQGREAGKGSEELGAAASAQNAEWCSQSAAHNRHMAGTWEKWQDQG